MNSMNAILALAVTLSFVSNAEASKPKCKTVNDSLARDSQLYRYADELAELHVYYGDIRAKKVGKISKTFLTDACTKDGMKGYVLRFQTFAKVSPQSAQKLFYCYSKITQQGANSLRNQGTFCSKVNGSVAPHLEFPYDQPSDPYSRFNTPSIQSDVDGLQDEFNHSRTVGIDSGFDPFYDTNSRNDNGPDSRTGTGL